MSRIPDRETLLDLLYYEPVSGRLVWRLRRADLFAGDYPHADARTWNNRFAYKDAFPVNAEGYRAGTLIGHRVLAHRVIWKMMTGLEPDEVDHINGDRLDNRWENLRAVARAHNAKNKGLWSRNTSGAYGVSWDKARHRWQVTIKSGGRLVHLGRFVSFDDAVAARKTAERNLGFHENHGARPCA